ncbi:MAG: cupin domain-containing protein [Spirochaetes bacterium]|jgi:mannose-6-phosphate isomerase-like protein (cupin superfamily)|nr:cupin domain-containing protein [Spirochaetota bacterium]
MGKGTDKKPYVVDIEELTTENKNFRTAEWTGEFLQMTTMSIEPGGEVGLEIHKDTDQFLRIEAGKAQVLMGKAKDNFDFEQEAQDDDAIFVPSGYWHNILNIGDEPLKLYSIYAPPHHPADTVHETYAVAMAEEEEEDH